MQSTQNNLERISMKALVYHGRMDVRIDDKPKPRIEHQEDIILKITKTALCGSDLHLYHGTVKGFFRIEKAEGFLHK